MISNYTDIRKEYENIRCNNLLKYQNIKNSLYDKFPKLKEYDLEIIDCKLNIGRAELDNLPKEALVSELEKLNSERLNFLKEHKIKDDYLEIPYTCEKCKDTGFINGQKCSCFVQKEIELFDNISHFKDYIKDDNFDNLDMSFYNQANLPKSSVPYNEYMKNVVDNVKLGIKNMGINPYRAMLIGPTGTGKTFLARCAGALALEMGKSVLYLNVNEYLASTMPDYEGEPLKQHAIDCDLLIIDDLGTEKISEHTNKEIYYIIDKRINDKKSSIITTNLNLQMIKDKYLDPTYSRLKHEYIQCYLAGEDLRRVKNANFK